MQAKTPQKIDQGGYPQDIFLDTEVISDFICPICLNVLRNPFTDNCQHMFCESCLNRLKAQNNLCPLSRQPLNNCLPVPKQLKAFLEKQNVLCLNYEKGCKWTGKLEYLDQHQANDCIIFEKLCQICEKNFVSKEEFEQHLKENAIDHYQKIEKKLYEKQESDQFPVLLDKMLCQTIKISIHEHPLRIVTNGYASGWFCDSLTDSPNQKCEMGHQYKSYEQRLHPKFKCTQGCNKTFCPKCVFKYLE